MFMRSNDTVPGYRPLGFGDPLGRLHEPFRVFCGVAADLEKEMMVKSRHTREGGYPGPGGAPSGFLPSQE